MTLPEALSSLPDKVKASRTNIDDKWFYRHPVYNYLLVSVDGEIYSEKTEYYVKGSSSGNGYRKLSVYKDGKSKSHTFHRIIAETLIPNPENKCCVNHKDGNKLNNNVDNLEWCTYSENSLHAYRIGLKKSPKIRPWQKKAVYQWNEDGTLLKFWKNPEDLRKAFNITAQKISKSIHFNRTCIGYIFTYTDQFVPRTPLSKGMVKITYHGDVIKFYPDRAAAAKDTGLDKFYIAELCRGRHEPPNEYTFRRATKSERCVYYASAFQKLVTIIEKEL